MTVQTTYSYDVVPYPSYAYPQTHPDHLATLATLSGLTPPPVEQCRVLEMGCAGGGNLIPMAYGLPNSHFVGVDLSGQAIARGQQRIARLDLKNITLTHQNILDLEVEPGQFDYIIAYGIYSWVPPEVQAKMLDICRRALAPNGIAYFSYNVHPGWRMNTIIREAMIYRTRKLSNPEERIERARQWLDFMVQTVPTENNLYGHFLNSIRNLLSMQHDSYVFHDFMEDINEPLYFHQFVERANRHGLQYLANAEFALHSGILPPDTPARLLEMSDDLVEVEQYLDFLTNRTFRETLLCHQEADITRILNPTCLTGLRVASQVQPAQPELDVTSTERIEFRAPDEAALSTAHPPTKVALLHLMQVWPRSVPFTDLPAIIAVRLGVGKLSEEDIHILAVNLLTAYSQTMSLVQLHTFMPHFVTEVSPNPVVSPTARLQAQDNYPISNMYHRRVNISELPRHLLGYIDGSRNRAELLEVLLELESLEVISVKVEDDAPVEDRANVRQILEHELDTQLAQMARAALLVG